MVVPVDLEKKEISAPKCNVMSVTSLGMPWERCLFLIALAQGFSRQGYRLLLVDIDFEVPLIATSLVNAGVDLESTISTNDWYSAEENMNIDDFLQGLPTVSPESLFPISVLPSSPDAKKLKTIQEMTPKQARKAFRRMTRLFKELQKEELFDIILLNVPYMTPHAVNGLMTADFNFVMVDHNTFAFNLLDQYISSLVGIYPMLNIAGLILHRFQFSPDPEQDAVTAARVEEKIRYPVVTKLPSIQDRILTRLDEQLWSISLTDNRLREFFENLANNLVSFMREPRRVEKKAKTLYYRLFIVHQSGIPLYNYTFKTALDGTSDGKTVLASAGLTSIISGTETIISEIIQQRDSAKLIEMRNMKLIIEQWKGVKAILMTNIYSDTTRRKLKGFIRHFVQKHGNELSRFLGDISPFEDTNKLIEEHLLERKEERKEMRALPLFLVRGIGKSRAWKLQTDHGIMSINDLVGADVAEIATAMNVSVTVVENWVEQGRNLLEKAE